MSALAAVQIGLIASPHQTSGSDRYYFNLCDALRTSNVDIRGVVLGDPASLGASGKDVVSFAPEGSRTFSRWRGLRRAFPPLLRGANLVVSHFAPHAFPVLDQLGMRPFVVHFHGPWALEGRAAGLSLKTQMVRAFEERTVYARAQRIIVLSRSFGAILREQYGVPAKKIRVIPGGVDLQRFYPKSTREAARRELGLPLDRPIVTTVRRLAPTKGIENLIDAAALVKARVPNALIVIAGTGQLAAALKERVRECGLEETVHFAGFVSDDVLPVYYRAADLFVVPTIAFEGFGLVVLEALACGTPVLVTPVSGLPEVVEDLDPRLVLRGSDAESIAAGVSAALLGELALPDEGQCVAYARRFGWDAIAERVRHIYAEVI